MLRFPKYSYPIVEGELTMVESNLTEDEGGCGGNRGRVEINGLLEKWEISPEH
jgi:hypothetical protein